MHNCIPPKKFRGGGGGYYGLVFVPYPRPHPRPRALVSSLQMSNLNGFFYNSPTTVYIGCGEGTKPSDFGHGTISNMAATAAILVFGGRSLSALR